MSYQRPQKPVREFRSDGNGTSITAAIWRHETEQEDGSPRVNHSIRLKKRYYDRDAKTYNDSDYLYPSDVPRAVLVLEAAYRHVALRERDPNSAVDSEPETDEVPDSDFPPEGN